MLSVTLDATSATRGARILASLGRNLAAPEIAGADLLLDALRREAPVRTGRLRDSLRLVRVGAASASYQAIGYAGFVVGGTKPHEIRPRNKRVLRFEVEGGVVFASLVRHPGTKPNDFPRRAVRRAEPSLRILQADGILRKVRVSFAA